MEGLLQRTTRTRSIAGTLAVFALASVAYLVYPSISRPDVYPVFHLLVELVGVVVGTAAFMLVWNTRDSIRNGYFVILGIPALGVVAVDLLHALSYKGIGILPVHSSNIPTQLWLIGRFLQAGALLVAVSYINRRVRAEIVLAVSAAITLVLLLSVYPLAVFPDAFAEGSGLTSFKVTSEYVICAVLGLAAIRLLRRREEFDTSSHVRLMSTIALLIGAELAFTLYNDPFGPANYVGHLARIGSYVLLYEVLVTSTVTRPIETLLIGAADSHRALRESEARFRATFEQATLGVMHIDPDGRIVRANPRMAEIAGRGRAALEAMNAEELTEPADRVTELELVEALADGTLADFRLEKRIVRPDGTLVWVNSSRSSVHDDIGSLLYFTEIVEDISIRKQAEEHLHRSRDLNAALASIDRAINSTFDIDEIIRRAVAEGAAALRADTASVLMREEDSWIARHTWRFREDIIGERFTDQDLPHAVEAAATGAPVAVEDTENDPRVNADVTSRFGIRSVIALPLAFRGHQIGTLYFNYLDEPHVFEKDDVDFVVKLSSALTLAIQNARLYEAEHHTVDAIQASLLQVARDTPGLNLATAYHSATELTRIGGDFFDVFMLPRGRIAFSIGDVSGKGLEAAATTAIAKSTLRAFAYEWAEPARVMNAANQAIALQSDEGRFITAIYGVLDPTCGEMTLVCAGHPPPIVSDAGGCLEEWTVGNPPLGVIDDHEFDESRITLLPGMGMVLFTDGLLDARQKSDFLGEQKVRAVIEALGDASPEAITARLLEAAMTQSGGLPPDDIAILAFRYTGPPAG